MIFDTISRIITNSWEFQNFFSPEISSFSSEFTEYPQGLERFHKIHTEVYQYQISEVVPRVENSVLIAERLSIFACVRNSVCYICVSSGAIESHIDLHEVQVWYSEPNFWIQFSILRKLDHGISHPMKFSWSIDHKDL